MNRTKHFTGKTPEDVELQINNWAIMTNNDVLSVNHITTNIPNISETGTNLGGGQLITSAFVVYQEPSYLEPLVCAGEVLSTDCSYSASTSINYTVNLTDETIDKLANAIAKKMPKTMSRPKRATKPEQK